MTNEEIQPDTKDWTWVLSQRCPECGFTATDVDGPAIAGTVRDLTPRWVSALHRADARDRPAPTTWSTLEYGAHVRDVMRIFGARLDLLLTQDDPLFENWDQDATALEDRYDLQDPQVVAVELAEAADSTAALFDSRGRRPVGPVGATVERLGVHGADARAVLPARRRPPPARRPRLTLSATASPAVTCVVREALPATARVIHRLCPQPCATRGNLWTTR